MKAKDEIKSARLKQKCWLIISIAIILTLEIFLLFSFLGIASNIININYELRLFLGMAISVLIIGVNIVIVVIARAIKIDLFDIHCNNSITEIDRQITGFGRLRNEIAESRGRSDKVFIEFREGE